MILQAQLEAPFRIEPLQPIAELLPLALQAAPPREPGPFRTSDLVDLATLGRSFRFDLKYATPDNFLGAPVYPAAQALLQREAAAALLRAERTLLDQGYGLLIYDAYRPWYVTWLFWEATPEAQRLFLANPATGSRHNRGCAVDVGLYHLDTGTAAVMPSGFDEFTERAYMTYENCSAEARWNRECLRAAMEDAGFLINRHEWWHYDFKDWAQYPILNAAAEAA